MGSILAGSIVTKVATILFDINGVEWSQSELLGWLNDGQRQIVVIAPWSNNVEVAMQMVVGTRQSIPDDGWMLIDIHRNMGTNGQTPGNGVRLVDRKIMDQFNSAWHSAAPVQSVQNFISDPFDKTGFWVSPPSDGTGYLWLSYSQTPPDVPALTSPIGVNDIFEPILIDYMLYRACLKRVDYSPGPEKAAGFWGAFAAGMSAKTGAEKAVDPNAALALTPPGPSV